MAARPHSLAPDHHRRRASVPGHHRRDDGTRRRVAVPADGPLPRAGRGDRGAARSALPDGIQAGAERQARSHPSRSGCCDRAQRSRPTAATTPPTCGPSASLEFLLLNAGVPAVGAVRRERLETSLRAIAQFTSPARRRTAERLAGRLHASLDYGQVDEILADDPHAFLAGIASHCAQIHGGDAPELHRLSDRVGPAGVAGSRDHRALHDSPRHEVRLRDAGQRERHGSRGCSREARATSAASTSASARRRRPA